MTARGTIPTTGSPEDTWTEHGEAVDPLDFGSLAIQNETTISWKHSMSNAEGMCCVLKPAVTSHLQFHVMVYISSSINAKGMCCVVNIYLFYTKTRLKA